MIEDRLSNSLTGKGYRRIDSNVNGIYLFYQPEMNQIKVVSVIHMINGTEITKEQYFHVLNQIQANFNQSQPVELKLLSLIFTLNPDQAKHLCIDSPQGHHWIVDVRAKRLIIYETQSSEDFSDIRDELEQFLFEEIDQNPEAELTEKYHDYRNSQARTPYRTAPKKVLLFTPSNAALVLINILVFLVLRYTNVLGGQEKAVSEGALSWYFVKEEREYYRILTSMFLHSDWSHLINNMLVLLFVGDNLERAAGKIRYLSIYFGAGIIAGITSISYNMWKDNAVFSFEHSVFSIGASGAIFGVVGAMLLIVIVNRGRLEDISTRQMILFILFSLYGGIFNARIDQAAHVGGFLAGFLIAALLYRRPKRTAPCEEASTLG